MAHVILFKCQNLIESDFKY